MAWNCNAPIPPSSASFLSRNTNQRGDEYGGSWKTARGCCANHRRHSQRSGPRLRDQRAAVRDELIRDGITLDETVAVARLLEADGLIDLINTSIGTATQTCT